MIILIKYDKILYQEVLSIKRLNVGEIVSVKEFCIKNNVGGTEIIKTKSPDNHSVKVRITRTWYDYETGEHAEGKLFNKEILKKVMALGEKFNPSVVYFSEFDLEENEEEEEI